MRFSRQSNNSAFSGLSESYSTWNKSRVINKQDTNNNKSYYILITAVSTLICLQIYLIALENNWQNIVQYFWKVITLLLIGLVIYASLKYFQAGQYKQHFKYSALVPNDQYNTHIKRTTEIEISKLQKDPRFKNIQSKIRKGSQIQKITSSDEQFFNQLDQLQSQFSFQN